MILLILKLSIIVISCNNSSAFRYDINSRVIDDHRLYSEKIHYVNKLTGYLQAQHIDSPIFYSFTAKQFDLAVLVKGVLYSYNS